MNNNNELIEIINPILNRYYVGLTLSIDSKIKNQTAEKLREVKEDLRRLAEYLNEEADIMEELE